ncbi:hypothetical protein [Pyrococcus kukulkanii]|uniref:hypothetical protein n=1 Tax=Pyrococcus kukulkanii TaxID=1609559 RepID=UPI0035619451
MRSLEGASERYLGEPYEVIDSSYLLFPSEVIVHLGEKVWEGERLPARCSRGLVLGLVCRGSEWLLGRFSYRGREVLSEWVGRVAGLCPYFQALEVLEGLHGDVIGVVGYIGKVLAGDEGARVWGALAR